MTISLRSPRAWWMTLALFVLALTSTCFAQADPPIPSGSIRIHYFRPDGNYLGWTIYAFGDTTEPNNFGAGPVVVTGSDGFGAYFDVGVTSGAANVGIILHKGNTKDPGPNEFADPATQGNEYWQLSGSNVLQTTQPPTIQATDPPIPAGKARIHYNRPDNNYGGWSLYPFFATTDPTGNFCNTEDYVSGYDTYGAYYDVGVDPSLNGGQLGFIIHSCQQNVKDPGPDMHLQVNQFTSAWVLSGSATVFTSQPVTEYATDPPIPAGHARIHYYRPDGNYAGWILYPFGATSDPTGDFCNTDDYVAGYDSYGAFYDVGITTGTLGFIIHNCSTGVKDPGPDMHLQVPDSLEAWIVSGNATVFLTQPTPAQLLSGVFDELQAYLARRHHHRHPVPVFPVRLDLRVQLQSHRRPATCAYRHHWRHVDPAHALLRLADGRSTASLSATGRLRAVQAARESRPRRNSAGRAEPARSFGRGQRRRAQVCHRHADLRRAGRPVLLRRPPRRALPPRQ